MGYYDFSTFLKLHFPYKVQKIAINAGFTCPNRDGNKGFGGCTYCNNQTFNPGYCRPEESITEQLEEGKRFFARKYPEMKYLAYFQAYTNTYADLQQLKRMYEEALAVDDVVGIIIGTRPDCMPQELLDYLAGLSRQTFVMIEYGAESANNSTLAIINRGHTWEDTADAVRRTASKGILCGLHLILGLPGENENDILATADIRTSRRKRKRHIGDCRQSIRITCRCNQTPPTATYQRYKARPASRAGRAANTPMAR